MKTYNAMLRKEIEIKNIREQIKEENFWGLDDIRDDASALFYDIKEAVKTNKSIEDIMSTINNCSLIDRMITAKENFETLFYVEILSNCFLQLQKVEKRFEILLGDSKTRMESVEQIVRNNSDSADKELRALDTEVKRYQAAIYLTRQAHSVLQKTAVGDSAVL
ncbi:MAG: hypothetical protein JNL74_20025 [Fibrobacteres bacterium]|nr:hypothetical protein [Fibrobacterota bacterium]